MSSAEWCRFPRVVVYVAGLDFLKERDHACSLLEKKVVEVKLVETEGEVHGFNVQYPESKATHLLQKQMSEFILNF